MLPLLPALLACAGDPSPGAAADAVAYSAALAALDDSPRQALAHCAEYSMAIERGPWSWYEEATLHLILLVTR